MPLLSFGAALTFGERVERDLRQVADDLTAVIIPDCGHYCADEKPEALLAELKPFLLAGDDEPQPRVRETSNN
jgi:pimeloyl-ACP methyl ester carboxylesterase